MFCGFNMCGKYELSENMYKVVDYNNNSNIIKCCRDLVDKFLENNQKQGNFWQIIRVTEELQTNCFGNKTSMSLIHYNDEMFEMLVDESWKILNKEGFDVEAPRDYDNMKELLIEIHYSNADTKTIYSDLSIHRDNDIYMRADLHTLLVYVDIDCEGGNLDIYDNTGNKVMKKIITKCEDKNKTRCVILNGECYHRPCPIISGKRLMVSFHFRKNYRNYSNDTKVEYI